jgi:Uma2 family endonuclease
MAFGDGELDESFSMATATTRLTTADEFFDFVHRPENRDRMFELEEGEIVEMSRPAENHGWVCGNLAFILGLYVRQIRRGYVCMNDTGLILDRDPDTVRGPDAILYLQSKKPSEMNPKYSDSMPTFVAEVLPPNDKPARTTRRSIVFSIGASQLWG